jgi:hypothetical protein
VLFSDCRSVNEYWTVHRLLRKLISEFVALATRRATAAADVKPRLPKHVRKLILVKHRAWRRWKASSSSADKDAYNRASRACRLSIRQHLAAHENDLNAGSRRFYSVSRQLNHEGNDNCILTRSDFSSNPRDVSAAAFSEEFSRNFSPSPIPPPCFARSDYDQTISRKL